MLAEPMPIPDGPPSSMPGPVVPTTTTRPASPDTRQPMAIPIVAPDGTTAGVERLPTATQAHRLRIARPVEDGPMPRMADARLARLHLRGGMLHSARAALEHMAGAGTLDREALADLAETRWRSGDLMGAAEAAEAHLQARGDEPIARVIAAEQSAHDGRILDARQLAMQVQGQVSDGVERLFAGEPRSAVWPAAAPGWMDAGAALPGRWGLLVGGAEVADPDSGTWPTAPMSGPDDPRVLAAGSTPPHAARDAAPFRVPMTTPRDPAEASREADRQLEDAEHDLERGDLVALADRLGLLLRRDPALAPVILSIVDHALAVSSARANPGSPIGGPPIDGQAPQQPAPPPVQGTLPWVVPGVASLQLLRGDILRGLGHDGDATQAYQEALRALPGRAISMESP
jgi:hypothetical protein